MQIPLVSQQLSTIFIQKGTAEHLVKQKITDLPVTAAYESHYYSKGLFSLIKSIKVNILEETATLVNSKEVILKHDNCKGNVGKIKVGDPDVTFLWNH